MTTAATISMAAAIAIMSGCDGSASRTESAVREARVKLQTLSIGGSNVGGGAPSSTREKAYNDVVKELSGLSPANANQKAMVSALLARGNAGLAQLEVEKAAIAEAEVLRATLLVQTGLDQWLQQSSTASALEQFDVSQAAGEIDAKVTELKAELAAANQELQQSQSDEAALTAKIAEGREAAGKVRASENEIRQKMVSASEVERLSLLEQASEFRRQADGLEKNVGYVEAELVTVKPETEAKRREVARLETTIRLMGQTRADLLSKAEATSRAASEAGGDAQQARTKLDERLKTLDEARQQAIEPWKRAAELYGKSASTISQGGGVNKDKGLDKGAYYQLAGDAQWALSRSHAGYAALMNRLALAGQLNGDFAAKAESAKQEAETARMAAAESYQQAVDALGGVQEPLPETPAGDEAEAGDGADAPAAGSEAAAATTTENKGDTLVNRLEALRKKLALVSDAVAVPEAENTTPSVDEVTPADETDATDEASAEPETVPADGAGMDEAPTDEPPATEPETVEPTEPAPGDETDPGAAPGGAPEEPQK